MVRAPASIARSTTLGEEVGLGAGGVLGRELDVVDVLARHLHALDGAAHDLFLRHGELELAVDGARGEEDVKPRARGFLQGVPRAIDVLAIAAREPRNHGASDSARDLSHGLEVAVRGDGKAGLEHVDAELRQRLRHAKLAVEIHARARRLLAVAQRGVEDQNSIRFRHYVASPPGWARTKNRRESVGDSPQVLLTDRLVKLAKLSPPCQVRIRGLPTSRRLTRLRICSIFPGASCE